MMIKHTLVLLVVFVAGFFNVVEAQEKTYTAQYVNLNGWENVYALAYTDNRDLLGGWPGTQMQLTNTQVSYHGVNYPVYQVTISSSVDPKTIVFSNGDENSQTEELAFVDGKQYLVLDMKGNVACSLTEPTQLDNSDKWKIYNGMPKIINGIPSESETVTIQIGDAIHIRIVDCKDMKSTSLQLMSGDGRTPVTENLASSLQEVPAIITIPVTGALFEWMKDADHKVRLCGTNVFIDKITVEADVYEGGSTTTEGGSTTTEGGSTTEVDYDVKDCTLSETTDNAEWIESNDGKSFNVTLTRTLDGVSEWNTFAVPFNISSGELIVKGITAKELTNSSYDSSTGKLTLVFATANSIKAGKPYLVKVANALNNPKFNVVKISKTPNPTTISGVIQFIPTMGSTSVTGSKSDILFLAAGNKLTHPNKDNPSIKGFRAYFQLLDTSAGTRTLLMDFGDGETTSIDVRSKMEEVRNGARYDLSGHKVVDGQLMKGIYIVDGKKVIIK